MYMKKEKLNNEATSNITINIIQLCQTEYLYSLFLLMYFKHNGMSSTKKQFVVHIECTVQNEALQP